tara:strand:+ start:12999 stop:13622 length:624 start_codon:yes stop_codon:yes gene_type:complete
MTKVNFIHIPKNAGTSIEEYCNNSQKLSYNGHDAKISSLDNQMIIIRDPYSRFCSAVKYAIENYSNSEKIRKIINVGLKTPSQWAEVWGDKSHKYHNLIIDEVTNHEHKIDSVKIPLKWTYTPQHYWINENKLKYVVPFDDMETYLVHRFGGKVPNNNVSTNRRRYKLSKKAKDFLKKMYKKDFEFIEKYSNFQVSTWYLDSNVCDY